MEFTGERIIPHDHHAGEGTQMYAETMARYYFARDLLQRDWRVLDIACGVGNGTAVLAEHAREAYGVDIDEQSVRYGKEHYGGERIFFSQGDGVRIPFEDESFHAVASFATIEHIAEYKTFLQEVRRVLKPGGLLILSTPDREINQEIVFDTTYKNPYHIKEFTHAELRDALAEYFTVEEAYGQLAYHPSSTHLAMRNVARFVIQFDAKKILKKILPLSLVFKVPKMFAGMNADVSVFPLEKGMRAQENIFVCRK